MSLTSERLATLESLILDGYTSELKKIVSKFEAQKSFYQGQLADHVGSPHELARQDLQPRLKVTGSFHTAIRSMGDSEIAETDGFFVEQIIGGMAKQVSVSCNSACLSCKGLKTEVRVLRHHKQFKTDVRISSHCSMRNAPCPDEMAPAWKAADYLKSGGNGVNDGRFFNDEIFAREYLTSPFENFASPETLMEISMKKSTRRRKRKGAKK
jgi:hypothetical protein